MPQLPFTTADPGDTPLTAASHYPPATTIEHLDAALANGSANPSGTELDTHPRTNRPNGLWHGVLPGSLT
jgi:hypothetical protein